MRISFMEPTSARYIHINSATNKIHLLVPVVGGQEISTDNTCQAKTALKNFFEGDAVESLNAYKNALELDIILLVENSTLRSQKEERLAQIAVYLDSVHAMQYTYAGAVSTILTRPSNLFSVQLRPRAQDPLSEVINPAFFLTRENNAGIPISSLFNAMHETFPATVFSMPDPRTTLTLAVLKALSATPTFSEIQAVLEIQSSTLFNISLDFHHRTDGTLVTQKDIEDIMCIDENASPQEYIYALLGCCVQTIWECVERSPFYCVSMEVAEDERTERLSMITQFYLAIFNIFCKTKDLSAHNFGVILDKSPDLSLRFASMIRDALNQGLEVEHCIANFFNKKLGEFGLSRMLSFAESNTVKQKFTRMYRTITATDENPHMDDFLILDIEARGENARFVTHQGSICINFAEIVDSFLPNQDYFELIRYDFRHHSVEIPHKNEEIPIEFELEPAALLARINNDQFEQLPESIKQACRLCPNLQVMQFLLNVAQGKQDEAELCLTTIADRQKLLTSADTFTDYSGRTVHCTAYEYAHWAKDTYMCRMLQQFMDDETKSEIAHRITRLETHGLTFQQFGKTNSSTHFALENLIGALQRYVVSYNNHNHSDMINCWQNVSLLQRDVPAHVIQEYCRPDRTFSPCPNFNEHVFPRSLSVFNKSTNSIVSWFPLNEVDSLESVIGLVRGGFYSAESLRDLPGDYCQFDLAALNQLNTVRTTELIELKEDLYRTEILSRVTM